MKNMKRRCLCLAMSISLAMVPLSGCGGNGNTSSSKTSTASSGTVDFGGKTIKIAVWYEPEVPTLGSSESGDAWYYSMEAAKEKYNCDVEWVVNPQETHFSKFVQASLSGEVYADILMCHSWNYVSLIKQNLLVPTDEFIDSSEDPGKWEKSLYTWEDKCWALQPANTYNTPTVGLFYNTKIIQELGLESPQTLALDNQWTWDKFREYCKKATDPALERYGVSCFMLPDVLKVTNGFSLVAKSDEDGRYYNGFTYSKTKQSGLEILEYVQSLANDGSIMGSWPAGQSALDEGEEAFIAGKVLFCYARSASSMKSSGMKDFSVVTAPVGPSGTGVVDQIDSFAFWSLPTESSLSAADRAAFWMDAKNTWDPDGGDGYYVPDEEDYKEELLASSYWNMSDVEFMLTMGQRISRVAGTDSILNMGSIVADGMYGAVIRGESTPAAVISSADNVIQSKIDSGLNS